MIIHFVGLVKPFGFSEEGGAILHIRSIDDQFFVGSNPFGGEPIDHVCLFKFYGLVRVPDRSDDVKKKRGRLNPKVNSIEVFVEVIPNLWWFDLVHQVRKLTSQKCSLLIDVNLHVRSDDRRREWIKESSLGDGLVACGKHGSRGVRDVVPAAGHTSKSIEIVIAGTHLDDLEAGDLTSDMLTNAYCCSDMHQFHEYGDGEGE